MLGRAQEDLLIEFGTTIKHWHDYKYLGVNIFDDGALNKVIQERNI